LVKSLQKKAKRLRHFVFDFLMEDYLSWRFLNTSYFYTITEKNHSYKKAMNRKERTQ